MRARSFVYIAVAMTPMIAAFVALQIAEPFPSGWLDPAYPYYWLNLMRAFALLVGGVTLGMITYTMVASVHAEETVTGGHPRKLLYRHVTVIAAAHGFLILALLFYVRSRVNHPFNLTTPLSLVGMIGTIYALAMMITYQNSRLRRFHLARQVLGTIQADPDDERVLCIRPVGSVEQVSLDDWFSAFGTGELVRLTVEKVEEEGVEGKVYGGRSRG